MAKGSSGDEDDLAVVGAGRGVEGVVEEAARRPMEMSLLFMSQPRVGEERGGVEKGAVGELDGGSALREESDRLMPLQSPQYRSHLSPQKTKPT